MIYKQLGTSELAVSEIGFGCMSLGLDHNKNSQILHKALDLGVNFFDTADLYEKGENEITLGKAFKGMRDQVILASKVGNVWREDGSTWDWNPSKEYIKSAIFLSLKRLQSDYLDLYQLHGGTIADPIAEIIAAFEELKQEGWIRYYGISSIRPNVIYEYVQCANITSVMMQYSLLDRRPEKDCLDFLQENQISVVVRGALAKGLLISKEPKEYLEYSTDEVSEVQKRLGDLADEKRTKAHLAIRYTLAHPAVATVAVGASNLEQLQENSLATKASISAEELVQLKSFTRLSDYKEQAGN